MPGTYTQPFIETPSFNVINSSIDFTWDLDPTTPNGTDSFQCLDDNDNINGSEFNIINPVFGSLIQEPGNTTSTISATSIQLKVESYIEDYTYDIKLLNVLNNESQDLGLETSIFGGAPYIQLPATLNLGTYNIIIEEINSDGVSSFMSTSFVWHTPVTSLSGAVDNICTGTSVDFSIGISSIESNYSGSFYRVNFGDNSQLKFFTHSELLIENYIQDNTHSINHTYLEPSCSVDGPGDYQYVVDLELFNKFKNTNAGDCFDYIQNGNGKSAYVNTSLPPTASFTMPLSQCVGNSILVENTSTLGLWGNATTDGECSEDPSYQWYIKNKHQVEFLIGLQSIKTFQVTRIG